MFILNANEQRTGDLFKTAKWLQDGETIVSVSKTGEEI
jgi:hypothetical protein